MWLVKAVIVAAGLFGWLRMLWYAVLIGMWWYMPDDMLRPERAESRRTTKALVRERWSWWVAPRMILYSAFVFAVRGMPRELVDTPPPKA